MGGPGLDRPSLEIIRRAPFNAETPSDALIAPETPIDSVYVRSNFDVPELGDDHAIVIGGRVRTPLTVSVAELAAMPQRVVGATMECAGNDRMTMAPLPVGEPWQHGAVSTVLWRGVSLRAVLERAGLLPDAIELLFSGADSGRREDSSAADSNAPVRFERSLPCTDALHDDVLLALEMNRQPLSRAHGAPVRLVVPGWYGMASVKWLTSITATATPFTGYFQRQRYVFDREAAGEYTPVTRMRVKSIITSPAHGERCDRELTVRGWAWSGDGAITRVELAVDGGDAWREALLGSPVSAHAWTPFSCTLSLAPGTRCALRSRATDAAGNTQPPHIAWNRLGYGNNAVRSIVVDVRE